MVLNLLNFCIYVSDSHPQNAQKFAYESWAHSLIAAVVFGVKNPCLFSFFLHPQGSGQVEADSSTEEN